MKSFNTLKLPVMLLGLGGALLLSPACRAQEVNPDHFTDTGVEGVYPAAPAKTVARTVKQGPAASVAQKHKSASAVSLQLAAENRSSLPTQPPLQAVANRRRVTPSAPKK